MIMATSYRHDEETNETANSYDWLLHDYGHDAMNQTPAWRIEYNHNRLHDLFAHDTWANLYADLCARLVIRLRCSPWIGFGLLTVGVLGMLAGLAWLGWTMIS